MNVIWRKAWSDLWRHKVRSLLVVASIAVGVFAVGLTFGMADQMDKGMDQAWLADQPQAVTLFLSAPISRDEVSALGQLPGVAGIEPAAAADARYTCPNCGAGAGQSSRDGTWHQAVVWMRADYHQQTYGLYQLAEGTWPQGDELGMERLQADFYGVNVGDRVTLQVAGKVQTFPITGKIRHPYAPPPNVGVDLAYFFADAQGMAGFGVPPGQFNTLLIAVTPYSAELARQVAGEVRDTLAEQHITIVETQYQDPARHWGRDQMDPMVMVMQVLAVAALALSMALVFNTVTGLINQQTHQIGILKAVGATRATIVKLYLAVVAGYGLLALGIAVPLGAVGASYAARYFLNIFDIPHDSFAISGPALIAQVLAALVVPVLAALPAILVGAGISVRQALASYGLGADFGTGRVDGALLRLARLALPVRYAVAAANTFRRKRRLLLTGSVLVIAGTIFLMLTAALASMAATVDGEFARRNYDLTVRFDQMQPLEPALAAVGGVAGVQKVVLTFGYPVGIARSDRTSEAPVHSQLTGVPLDDPMYRPLIVEGRWLQPSDERAVVIGQDLAQASGLKVGDTVTLDLAQLGRSDWVIVGLHQDMPTSQMGATFIYAPRDAIWRATGQTGWGNFLVVRTAQHDAPSVNAVADQIQARYRQQGVAVAEIMTGPQERRTVEKQFGTVVQLLMMLAVLTAVVGAIGLAGALSLGVIERTQEIGVLRAIGGRSRTIVAMFVLEALLQCLLSWLVALPVSLLVAPLLSQALGRMLLGVGLSYRYDFTAAWGWLVAVLVLGTAASILPAMGASGVSVRQSLAYE